MAKSVADVLSDLGWKVVHCLEQPPKAPEFISFAEMPLQPASLKMLEEAAPGGVYRHQAEAITRFLDGDNICMTTGTASGKSLAFQVAAVELLARDAEARVIAVYPLKALGREQRDRWAATLKAAGIPGDVGVIDGQVEMGERLAILRSSRIAVMTPDIIHAWMLSRLSDATVRNFLRRVALAVVDEVHNYTGVFGSNAAFLLRRLQHALGLVGSYPRYFCASATLADPAMHLERLFGLPFRLVEPDVDTSPRHKLAIWLVERPQNSDLLSELSGLLTELVARGCKLLAFVDSRKQTEHIASIAARAHEMDDDEDTGRAFAHLTDLSILPYRAGYEERDRAVIQRRLSKGDLAGVVSTSALELGIDIPFLDTGALVGVPRSSTNLVQRVGRIGRRKDGDIVVVNTGTVYDEAIFSEPASLLARPPAEGALYLENERIQYIHTLCLARLGGEHDQLVQAIGVGDEKFGSATAWPDGFLELCDKERLGEVPSQLFAMKAEAGDDPNHTFPLRDVESSFAVRMKSGPEETSLGSLSYSQVMREAYPGAVYYYTTKPFRVTKVGVSSRRIHVRKEKRYTTRPLMLPTLVFPNLTGEAVSASAAYGDALVIDCDLQIRQSITGFKERRGPNEFDSPYPLDAAQTGVYFSQLRFSRNYFTTGVVIAHPALNAEGVSCDDLASLMYEAFLIAIPFERQDIDFASDKFRADRGPLKEGDRFLALYDQTYGSLHLSSRLLHGDTFLRTAVSAASLAGTTRGLAVSDATLGALDALAKSASQRRQDLTLDGGRVAALSSDKAIRVIRPGSKGLDIMRDNEEFAIEGVFYSPDLGTVAYRGHLASNSRESVTDIIPIQNIAEIPGESEPALYNPETGELQDLPHE